MKPLLRIGAQLAEWLVGLRHFVLASCVLFLVVTGVAFYLVYRDAEVMHARMEDQFNDQQLFLSRQTAARLAEILGDIRDELNGLRTLVARGSEHTRAQAVEAVYERVRSKGVLCVGLMTRDGRLLESRGETRQPQRRDAAASRAGWDKAPADDVCLGSLDVEPQPRGAPRVTGTFWARAGELVLFVRTDVTRLVARVTRTVQSGSSGYAWVIDEGGTFLYHPEVEFVGRNAFTAREEREPYISFTQINRIMQERMLRGEEGTARYVSGWHRVARGEIQKLIAFTPVRSASLSAERFWSVAVAAPTSEVAEAVSQMRGRHYAVGAALVAGVFVFGILVVISQRRISVALREQIRRTEAELQEAERIYRRIVQQATDLIYILDLNRRVVLLNPNCAQMFSSMLRNSARAELLAGRDLDDPDTYAGHRIDDLFRPAEAAFMHEQVGRVLHRRSSQSYDHTITVKGNKVFLHSTVIPIRDDQERIYRILCMSRDQTERIELEQRIYNTEKLASIGTLASGVAHEINNPLAVILGFTDLLIDKFPEESPIREDLKVIEYNANHAKKVVENLLGFARITEGLEDTVDVAASVETVMAIVRNTLMTKKIELSVDVPDDLPRVRGDAREVQQVLFNLINNAVAAMEEAKCGVLKVSARSSDGWVHVGVTDSGTGIPEEIKPRIFDPFFTTKKVGEGTGLGLSLCYGIVKKYGGKITFWSQTSRESPDGRTGTTFTISMPARDAAPDVADKESADAAPADIGR